MEGKVADMAMCLPHTGLSVTWYLLYVRQALYLYSVLTVFLDGAPTNTHGGQWQVRDFPN